MHTLNDYIVNVKDVTSRDPGDERSTDKIMFLLHLMLPNDFCSAFSHVSALYTPSPML